MFPPMGYSFSRKTVEGCPGTGDAKEFSVLENATIGDNAFPAAGADFRLTDRSIIRDLHMYLRESEK
jgi:hypothetical protein